MSSAALLLLMTGPAWAGIEPSEQNDVTITEFMADPSAVSSTYGEWFEIYNNAGENIDLDGLTITNSRGQSIEITRSFAVAIGDYIIFGASDNSTDATAVDYNGGVQVDYVYDPADFDLRSSSDSIEITFERVVIDVVEWDSSWGLDTNHAHQCQPSSFDLEWANDSSLNWCPAEQPFDDPGEWGTPGEPNEYCVSDPGSDDDGDGFAEDDGDCRDDDANVNPDHTDSNVGSDFNTDSNCDGVRDDGSIDNDDDGYSEIDGDCDDTDPDTHPGARENPDNIDNDCDDCTDDVDEDGDGYGGYGDEGDCGEDCNDADRNIYPGATEVPYDDEDQDCDGVDWCDVDGDGYDYDGGTCAGSDCDDDDPLVGPGVEEVPDNEIDDDCDGIVDIPDLDGDTYRSDEGDCMDLPPEADPDGLSAQVHPEAEELCDGLDNDCDGFFDNTPNCAGNPAANATVRGGGLCGVAPASGGAFPTLAALALALVATLRRRGGDV
ncbi:MAG: MopE-related protein [Myxococcota bacterium]